jgi:soluble lytic murein transglycosylase-like protein
MRNVFAVLALAGAMLALVPAGVCAGYLDDVRPARLAQGAAPAEVLRAKRCAPPFGCRVKRKQRPRADFRADMAGLVDQAAQLAGVPIAIARAIVRHESGFNPAARSPAGAIGLGQILFGTARSLGYAGTRAGLYDPHVNLKFSMRYLRMALDRGGHGCAGLSLYERGIYARLSCTTYGRNVARLAMR